MPLPEIIKFPVRASVYPVQFSLHIVAIAHKGIGAMDGLRAWASCVGYSGVAVSAAAYQYASGFQWQLCLTLLEQRVADLLREKYAAEGVHLLLSRCSRTLRPQRVRRTLAGVL